MFSKNRHQLARRCRGNDPAFVNERQSTLGRVSAYRSDELTGQVSSAAIYKGHNAPLMHTMIIKGSNVTM